MPVLHPISAATAIGASPLFLWAFPLVALLVCVLVTPAAALADGAQSTTAAAAAADDDEERKKKRRKKRNKRKKKKKKKAQVEEAAETDDEPTPSDEEAEDEADQSSNADEGAGQAEADPPKPRANRAADSSPRGTRDGVRMDVIRTGASPRTFDARLDFSVLSREGVGRVAAGLVAGWNVHHAVAVDLKLAWGDGRDDTLEFLSTAAAVRVRPLRFGDDTNTDGSFAVQVAYELFLGTELGDAAALDLLVGYEYRTPGGLYFLALVGPSLLFQDVAEFQDALPRAQVGFGYSL